MRGEGFQYLLILDLWGISFHAVVVFGLGKKLLFKSILGHCGFTNSRVQSIKKKQVSIIYQFIRFWTPVKKYV